MQHEIKPSVQRIAVMEYLMKHHTHPTVDEIHQALAKKIPTLSKTTVYNTLKLLTDKGAAQMLTIDERSLCFDGNTDIHAHFLCKQCDKIYDIPLQNLVREVENMDVEGHQIMEVHQYYKGVCKKCKNNTNII